MIALSQDAAWTELEFYKADGYEMQPARKLKSMSDKHPECPLYNPSNCKEYYNPKLCAFVRKDRSCLKRKKPKQKEGETK